MLLFLLILIYNYQCHSIGDFCELNKWKKPFSSRAIISSQSNSQNHVLLLQCTTNFSLSAIITSESNSQNHVLQLLLLQLHLVKGLLYLLKAIIRVMYTWTIFSDAPYYVRGVSTSQDVRLSVCLSRHLNRFR